MIHDNVKTEVVYKNKFSDQETYFFVRIGNMLYGVRREKPNWEWSFGTWDNYGDPFTDEAVVDIKPDDEMRKAMVTGLFKIKREFL